MPPKLIFTPDFSGYQAVFGVGAAKDSASAIGVFDSLVNSIIVSVAGTSLAVCSARWPAMSARASISRPRRLHVLRPVDAHAPAGRRARLLPPDVRPARPRRHAHRPHPRHHLHQSRPRDLDHEGLLRRRAEEVESRSPSSTAIRASTPSASWCCRWCKGGIAATAGFCFIFAWNEFAFSSILTTTQAKTLPVQDFRRPWAPPASSGRRSAPPASCSSCPLLIFFYLIRKHLLMGMTFGVLGKAAG